MNGKALASMAVVAILLVTAVCIVPPSDATGDTDVLLDHGNGSVEWTQSSGGTVEDVLADAMIGLGVDFEISSGTISVDGVSSKTVGSSSNGGSLEESGATGATVTTEWHVFLWYGSSWVETDELSVPADASAVALAFYPDGIAPVVTPDHPYAVTMSRGDSSNTGNFDADYSSGEEYEVTWSETGTAHANILYAGGYVFQKYGIDSTGTARVVCIDGETGEHVWEFEFTSGSNYESSTPLIVGDWIYVATMTGYIYRIPLYEGPGENNANVTSIGGVPFSEASPVEAVLKDFEVGNTYDSGFSSMVFDSGVIYVTHSNGMVYCFDTDLSLIWSQMLDGSTYLVAPTVYDGYLFTGALDGRLYVLDAVGGGIVADTTVAQYRYQSKVYGGVGQVAVQPTGNGTYTLYMTFSDGLGMSQINCGFAIYEFSPSGNVLVERYRNEDLGDMGRYILPVDTPDFRGVYFVAAPGSGTNLYRIDSAGNLETMTEGLAEIHSAPVLADDRYIYLVSYSSSDPIYQISLDGTIVGTASCPSGVRNFNMIPLVVLGDTIFGGTDSGIYRFDGVFPVYVAPSLEQGQPLILIIAEIVAAILVALGLVYAVLRFKGHEKPFNYLKTSFLHYLYGDDQSHNTRNKHRLKFIIVIGAILTFAAFTLCLCVGSTSIENPVEAYSALFSAISKGGVGLDSLETTIYVSRLPRTIAALAVGIGLSVAGCIYQAIIRNPLVDPYIMGVSSGAGVAAIAVIAFDFTFFGMFSSHSIFLTAITACIGGLIAFACTMLLAEKSGGSAINYVLSGVVIGLAFSAVQTIMLTMAGNKLSNALSWLYGSFAEVTWSQVGIIVFLAVFLSLVPLIWAKELNLVLLGEDQARQMGLNVRRFNRWMLILASILTSVCVAFCGVIGFVGLVIPHLCRMLLGSDHRMVLPASICFGGVMLMLADLLARTGYYGMELPVGAITTVIGIPVFAYLLIKRGRMYDG
ncbi:iron chelate uptake ABC transporter family permease subunit [Methanomassiliicoccaceae archaeon DOK]|nr:iron chelate uptake ABC transporter family permease subunit [Methanomassiliicoccaceae archaeon DOK]